MAVNDYDPIIQQAASEWNIDPLWLKAIMQQETGGQPTKNGRPIRSSAGAGGLMQIMPGTATGLGVQDVDHPAQNIFGSAKLLSELLDKYKSVPVATAAYNTRPETVDAWLAGKSQLPPETQAYVPAVASHYAKFAGNVGAASPASPAPSATSVPSDDDFLKSVGAGQSAAPIPSDDDFLKSVGAVVPSTPSPQGPASPVTAPPAQPVLPSPSNTPMEEPGDTELTSAQIAASRARIAQSPYSALEPTEPGFKHLLWSMGAPFMQVGETALGYRPIPQGLDAAGLAATAATGLRFGGANPLVSQGIGAAERGSVAASETSPIAAIPSEAGWTSIYAPQTPGASPLAPSGTIPLRSAGAAGTPVALTNMAPAEAAASRATGEMQRVLAPAKEGIDTTEYVPGVKPTEAEVSANPTVAAEQKFNRSRNPDPHIAQEKANNDARVEYLDQTAGTPTQVQRLKDARQEQANANLEKAFQDNQRSDVRPVVDTINGILGDPRLGERDLIRQYVSPILDKLSDASGTLKDNPKSLYGIREDVADKLSKSFASKDPSVTQVRPQLVEIKDVLDQAIEGGAPGYKKYLSDYAESSRPIDAMEYLQDARKTLTNANGTLMPGAYHRFMVNTVADRAARGINPAKSLTEDQMNVLHNIHSDLKRMNNINLSNPRGSDTNMLGHIASRGGELAAHGVANVVSPVLGSIAVQMGKNALVARQTSKMTQRVLNPSPLKYPPSEP
jgi:hypothetical protein